MQPKRTGHIIRTLFKTLAWIVVFVISLFVLVLFLIQLPSFQNYGRKKVVSYLENKIGTKVRIAHLDIDFPKLIVLEGIYFGDQLNDTLLSGKKLKVDISLFKLFNNKVEINEIALDGITANLHRDASGVFNFDYILNAFAGDPKAVPDTSAPMEIALDEINLDKINIKYYDDFAGYDLAFSLNHFDTEIKKFDLEKANYETEDITFEGVNARIRQFAPMGQIPLQDTGQDTSPPNNTTPFNIKLGDIKLNRILFDYNNEVDSITSKVILGKLFLKPGKIDMEKQRVTVEEFQLHNTLANIYLGKKTTKIPVDTLNSGKAGLPANNIKNKGWIISTGKLELKNNSFVYNDNSSPTLSSGLDYSHLDIKKLYFSASDFYYQEDSITGTINNLGFYDKSGLQVNKLETAFLYSSKQAYLKGLLLETPHSKLRRTIYLRYPSINAITKDPGVLKISANMNGSVIGLKDILYFAPQLATEPLFSKFPEGKLMADVVLTGGVNDLKIQKFELSGLNKTHIKLSGQISGLTDLNHLYANLEIPDLSTTDTDMLSLAPKGSLPSNIRLPAVMAISGNLKGNLKKLQVDLGLGSSFGKLAINGTVVDLNDSIKAQYTANITIDNFNVGNLLKQEAHYGAVNLWADIKGTGYVPSQLVATANGVISSAQINGYNYRNLKFKGNSNRGLYQLTAGIKDPNVALDLEATANLNGSHPAIDASLMIDSIALQPLNFTKENIRVHAKLTANIPNLDIDNLEGKVLATQLLVNTGTKKYVADTITITALSTGTENALSVNSPILYAGLKGNYTLSGIGTAIQQIINRHYHIGPVPDTRVPPQIASFYVQVFNSPLLREIIPGLSISDSIAIRGNINSNASTILIDGKIPPLIYGSNSIGKSSIKFSASDTAIHYAVNIDDISGAAISIPSTALYGSIKNNDIKYQLLVKDETDKEKYFIAGNVLQPTYGDYQFTIKPGGLLLDYEPWVINPKNNITFGNSGLRFTAFEISNAEQSLSLQSEKPTLNAPLKILLKNFRIETITRFAQQDSLYMGGRLNGNAIINNLNGTPIIAANLVISNFNYKKDTLGDITIKANNQTPDSYHADMSIKGNGNSVKANGDYFTSGKFDFDVNIDKLNLSTIESFTQGNLRQMSGAMTGNLKIAGTKDAPGIKGDLYFRETAMKVSMLNAIFRMKDERISFREDGIHFNRFTLEDSLKNIAEINGIISTTDYSKYVFNLDITADDFQVVNSRKIDNPLYYGQLFIDTEIHIRGDLDQPIINADLSVNDKTNMTIVLPQTNPQVAAREGIVEFFDQDAPLLDSILLAKYDTLNHSNIKGLDLVSNIYVDKDAEFSMVIDEANGDFIKLKGEANLSGGIDPSGKISLTGRYELYEGAYEMSFNFLKRKFSIQKGSMITWTGEPTTADVNITAVYVANAAPIDLVEQQLNEASATLKNTYKQKLPFNVLLTMTGELLSPELSFDIVLPEKNYSVSSDIINASNTRLAQIRQQPAELNKQVFALLLLNRFVAENPFSSSGGSTSVSTLAKQSVSKLLAEQLNRLAADLVSGVDINFGLETTEDYTTGQQQDRTDLNIGVSKQLLNDRLKVSVGSNFELEGPAKNNQRTNNIAGNIQVDYKLTKDGSLLLRGYRTDQYEVALQGQVVETGLTFILNVDYDKLNEILGRSKERKRIRPKHIEPLKEDQPVPGALDNKK